MNVHKFIPLAITASSFSKDPSTKVGCVAVDERGAIRSTGYNGFPRGVSDDEYRYRDRDVKLKLVAHAEANAIANAAAIGIPLINCSMIVTMFPCHDCAKLIINAGIKHIYTAPTDPESKWSESHSIARMMFEEAGVIVEVWKE
jgi:dCMP deaminase